MENKIEIGQELYYRGLGYGFKTHCFEIFEEDGIRYVHSNNAVKRKEIDVINNSCDLFSNKEEINKKLAGSWKAKLID